MKISAVVAMAHNNVIGRENGLPWHLSADLKMFKKRTMGHHIIMGRKTYESIGKPLPGRTSVIITRDKSYFQPGCKIAYSIEEALKIAHENGDDEAMIIGGGTIYKDSLAYCDKIYLTEIETEISDGDTFFPEINPAEWVEVKRENFSADDKNPYNYSFVEYERRL